MAEEQEAAAPKKKSKMMLFIIIGVVLLVVGGGGAFMLLKKKPVDAEEGDEPAHGKTEKSAHAGAPPAYVKLDTFTTNLAAENAGDGQTAQNSQYIQVVVELKVEDAHTGEAILKPYTPEIRNGILRALSSKKASQLVTAEGKDALAAEILSVVNRIVNGAPSKKGQEPDGPVSAVLFSSFIIQ